MSIPTLAQYADNEWRRMRDEYGVTLAEAQDLYPRWSFESQWFAQVRRMVDEGHVPSWQLWRSLTEHQQSHVLRTSRALKDSAFTRQLIALGA